MLKVFYDISLLRVGPQRLPASHSLLAVVLVAHAALGTVHGLFTLSPTRALVSAILSTLFVLAVTHGLLTLRGLTQRYTQTLTALAGCEALLGVVALPVSLAFHVGIDSAGLALLLLILIGWNVAIAGHVFRHALDLRPSLGLLLGLGYIVLSYAVVEAAFGLGA